MRALSLAIKLKVYVPGTANVAIVAGAVGIGKCHRAGAAHLLHVYVNAPGGFGRPSSVAEPLRLAVSRKSDCLIRDRHSRPELC